MAQIKEEQISSGAATDGQVLTADGSGESDWKAVGAGVAANPTGEVVLSAVNGVLTTYMRSDAAPPLSQAIVPTWTGKHTFDRTLGVTDEEKGVEIDINNSGTAAGAVDQYGLFVSFINAADDSIPALSVYGIRSEVTHSTAYKVSTLKAIRASVYKSGAGTATHAQGLYASVACTGGTISTARGAFIEVGNSATITTAYGLYIGDVQGTTRYGIYQSDALANNYFASNISQGDGKYIATDEIRARDSGGLKLYDDSRAAGIFVADGGNATFSGDIYLPDGGAIGISGNELLTVNAAGNFVFSGANVGIGGTPATSAKLEIASTTGALLVPRMTTDQMNALTGVDGMIVWNTTIGWFMGYATVWNAL